MEEVESCWRCIVVVIVNGYPLSCPLVGLHQEEDQLFNRSRQFVDHPLRSLILRLGLEKI